VCRTVQRPKQPPETSCCCGSSGDGGSSRTTAENTMEKLMQEAGSRQQSTKTIHVFHAAKRSKETLIFFISSPFRL
jgi:hypothetical protein